uniref:eIF-4F 25 kDa subunit n=1 Tax=Heterorhabditis bacteriophora TaxID=37862 RepID=A0A1I7X497_HETBA
MSSTQLEVDCLPVAKVVPMFVKETECGANEHPLEFTYVYSFFVRPAGKFDPEEYAQYVQPVAAVNSVEQFWSVYRHLKRPCDIGEKVDIHFFKKGIKPVWEDGANVKGGKWILRLKKGLASRVWENLLLAMVGEQFLVGEEICGAVCSIRNQEDIVSLWNRTADNAGVTNRIRDTLRRVLNLPINAVLEYKRHDDCLKFLFYHEAITFRRGCFWLVTHLYLKDLRRNHLIDLLCTLLNLRSELPTTTRVVRVYYPKKNTSTSGAVMFIHGGGFALGNIDMYDSLTRKLAKMINSVVFSVEYRLSPETPFPGGLQDCERALEFFIRNAEFKYGVDTNKIVIMGDSAGGNLAAVITQRRRLKKKTPNLLGQVLMYPLLQLADLQSISYRYFHKRLNGLALVDPESVAYYYMFYAGIDMDKYGHLVKYTLVNGHIAPEHREKVNKILSYDSFSSLNYNNETLPNRQTVEYSEEAQRLMAPFITNPDFSPLMREDLSGLPPGILYAKRLEVNLLNYIFVRLLIFLLKAAGVPTKLRNYENGFHAMLNFHNEVEEVSESLHEIADWTKRAIMAADLKLVYDMSDITLSTPDGVTCVLPRKVAFISSLISEVATHCDDSNAPVPLLNVQGPTLKLVDLSFTIFLMKELFNSSHYKAILFSSDWMQRKFKGSSQAPVSTKESKHDNDKKYDGKDKNLANWERMFFEKLPKEELFKMLNAANYMGIALLIDSGSSYIAELITGMSVEEARNYLNLESDLSEEHEEEMKRKHTWLEDKSKLGSSLLMPIYSFFLTLSHSDYIVFAPVSPLMMLFSVVSWPIMAYIG